MKYTLFSDPHLGTRRAAHTTRESSKRLTEALYQQALAVTQDENPVCLGDLFDRSSNPEETIVQGYNVASRCLWTLAGNHDSSNRADTVTSLDAIKEMGCLIVSSPNLNAPCFDARGPLFFVPHHASQQLFEQAMLDAAGHVAVERSGLPAVLLLHCNYDQPFASEDDTLNLPPAMAEKLLESFDYIFLGHEHRPSTHHNGRVVILGNTHPTSFADVSDKFVYHLDITDDAISLEKVRIWSIADRFAEGKFGGPLPDLSGVQFIDVIGSAEPDQAVDVADFISSVWAAAPDALAVRNNVAIGQLAVDEAERPALVDIRQRIAMDLEGSDLLELFNELVKESEQ